MNKKKVKLCDINTKLAEFNQKYGTPEDIMILLNIIEICPEQIPVEVTEYVNKIKVLTIK